MNLPRKIGLISFFIFFLVLFATPVLADLQNAQSDPDINIRLRRWVSSNIFSDDDPNVDKTLGIIYKYHFASNEEIDRKAPQLRTLLGNSSISSLHQLNEYAGSPVIPPNGTSNWGSTLVGMPGSGSEVLVPQSGYNIGGGYQATVLYATGTDITISYTAGESGIVRGYVVHLLDLAVEPTILNLYNEGKSQGKIVALPCGYPLGTTTGEILVSIRDTGTFFDPRSGYDWWQDNPTPLVCDTSLPPILITPGQAPAGEGVSLQTSEEPNPDPYVPCNQVSPNLPQFPFQLPQRTEDQFHSLRPYQSSPCDRVVHEEALYCGNDLIAREEFELTLDQAIPGTCVPTSNGAQRCRVRPLRSSVPIEITLEDSELPIVGNTENLPNSINDANVLDPLSRVNQYVSWYLNGVLPRAEEEALEFDPICRTNLDCNINPELDGCSFEVDRYACTLPLARRLLGSPTRLSPESHSLVVDLSGPLRKLLPDSIQKIQRNETIQKAEASHQIFGGAEIRHDQIVGCTRAGIPIPCYNDSVLEPLSQILGITLPAPYNYIARELLDLDEHWLSRWRQAPIRENYSDTVAYWRDYQSWRGRTCTPNFVVPVINKRIYLCYDNPLNPNYWGNLFSYIPLSSTEDRVGEVLVPEFPDPRVVTPQIESGDLRIDEITFEPDNTRDDVYFSHVQETTELASLLQQTFTARGSMGWSGDSGEGAIFYNTERCEPAEKRTNSGDDLFGDYNNGLLEGFERNYRKISGTINYVTTEFTCEFDPPTFDQGCYTQCQEDGGAPEACRNRCSGPSTCKRGVYVALSVFTKTPRAKELWERLVAGPQSILGRFFSKDLLTQDVFKETPGYTRAQYRSSDPDVEVLAGDPSQNRPGTSAEIYFPYLGDICDHFLGGCGEGNNLNLQKLLRPKGLSGSGGQAPSTGGSIGQCSEAPYPCSVENLLQYFDNDPVKAANASQICNMESGGDPFAINDSCLTGGTYDYSIGLFQINLVPGTGRCPGAFDETVEAPFCRIVNQEILEECVNRFTDPVENINFAYNLSNSGSVWSTHWVNSSNACNIP